MSHGHSHGGGGCRCAAEREEPPEQRGLAYGLYLRIDLERLQCLNESREGSGRGVFKPWEERSDRSKVGRVRPRAPRGDGERQPRVPGRTRGSVSCQPFGRRSGLSVPLLSIFMGQGNRSYLALVARAAWSRAEAIDPRPHWNPKSPPRAGSFRATVGSPVPASRWNGVHSLPWKRGRQHESSPLHRVLGS